MSKNKKASRKYIIICDSDGEVDGRVTVTDRKNDRKTVSSGSIELTCTGNGYVVWIGDTRIVLDYCEMADLLNAVDVLQLEEREKGSVGLRASSSIFRAVGGIP